MKFTQSWLKEHLETSAPLAQIAETLTNIGLEVEEVDDPSARLKDFIVAEVESAEPHPNANKLKLCRVNDGTRTRQIVCGAANARAGLKVVLAREGVFIPGSGITIKKTKIRDVESDGMLCSAEELQLAEKSEGIIELPANAKPGEPAANALGAADPVITIAVTPNRADCLGVRGLARDLAAAGTGTLTPLKKGAASGSGPSPIKVNIGTKHCTLFIGCLIRGVKNGPSPEWLQQKLKAIGLRPISALVDITNYFTFTYARPLHVFDAAKLKGNITVRTAKPGEKLAALNGKEYTLSPGMTVVADDAAPRALGGIIGEEASGCTESTTEVFLEAAVFDPVNIAETGRKLDIISDARYRFERGVDAAFTETGAQLAVQMILELCGGKASELVVAGGLNASGRSIAFSPARVETLGGIAVPGAECERILTTLGFAVAKNANAWSVVPPSWRSDVEGSADLVEEILRIHGYRHIPVVPVPKIATTGKPALNNAQKRDRLARRLLAARGMLEICSWSFLSEAQAKLFGWNNEATKLQNPISADLDTLRPSLLPNLLTAAKNNIARSIADLHVCEIGAQFGGVKPEEQKNVAAGIRTGTYVEASYDRGNYRQDPRLCDAFDAKADALALLEALGVNANSLIITRDTPRWYHPGRSGTLTLGGKIVLGYFGEVHPGICLQFDIESRVAAFETFLDAVPQGKAKGKAKAALTASAFQPVERDFAFVVKNEVTAAQIIRTLEQVDKALVKAVNIFDVYSGTGVEEGKKSVAVKVTLQAADRTLSEADITTLSTAIVTAAAKEFSGVLRQ